MSIQLLTEARLYLLELISLTFEDDPNFVDYKDKLDVEVGMDEQTERPFYRIVWGDKE
jgi:hypothetical protein